MTNKSGSTFYFLEYDDSTSGDALGVLEAISSFNGEKPLSEVYVSTSDYSRGLGDVREVLEELVPHCYSKKPSAIRVYSVVLDDSLYARLVVKSGNDDTCSALVFGRSHSANANNLLSRLRHSGHKTIDLSGKEQVVKEVSIQKPSVNVKPRKRERTKH